jgi:tripeptide aminopeptidase
MQQFQTVNRDRLLSMFLELLAMNSTSRHETPMARKVSALLTELGAEFSTDDAAQVLGAESGNIIAHLPGTMDALPLLFCAHLDTVAPTDHLRIVRENGRISSDGTTILGADDKAGVAAIFEMIYALREHGAPYPPLEFVFTVAEEVGVMGSMVLDYARLQAKIGFVPDSTGPVGSIITHAPAQKHLAVSIRGKAAHAGMAPESGINAITVAARAIAHMRQGRVDDETTANIGVIHGGVATNMIPATVEIEGEARSRDPRKLDEQVAHMRACFAEAAEDAGAEVGIEVTDLYPAFNLDDADPAVQLATAALAPLGISPLITATGGGSDANYFNGHGIATVILSAGYQHAHGTEEYIEEDQLVLLAQWLYNIAALAGEQVTKPTGKEPR